MQQRIYRLFFLICFIQGSAEVHPFVQRIAISHQEGINAYSGYGTNYTSASIFLSPNFRVGKISPFLDGRVHRFDNHSYSANVGLGGRFIPTGAGICHLIGGSLFYDYRRGHNWNYNQLGIGGEVLGKHLDVRLNFYMPFGMKKYSASILHDDYEGGYYAIHNKCESVSWGFNGEVGYTIGDYKGFTFYAATGPYYFSGKCLDKSAGWEFRVRPQYRDYLAIDFKVHYDNLYHTVFQTTFIFSIPIYELHGNKNGINPCNLTDRQIYQPIVRLETMPISRRSCWFKNF